MERKLVWTQRPSERVLGGGWENAPTIRHGHPLRANAGRIEKKEKRAESKTKRSRGTIAMVNRLLALAQAAK